MRKIMLPLVLLTTVFGLGSLVMVGCGGSSGGKEDMTVKEKPDMVQTTDFTAPAPGCAATLECEGACTGTSDEVQTCQSACEKAESKEGATLENAFYDCIYTACGAEPDNTDAGTGVCAYNPTTFVFDNQTACDACLSSAQSGSCSTELTACTNDTTGE